MTDWTIIRRSMTSRMFSTVTTVITVAVAVALMLVLLSMRDAGEKAFSRGGGNMHYLLSADSDPMASVLNAVFYARTPQRKIPWASFQKLVSEYQERKGIPLEYAIPIQQGDSFHGYPVLATTEEFFSKFMPTPTVGWSFREGRAFNGDFEVVLGSTAGRAAGLRLGDAVTLTHGSPGSRTAGDAPHEHAEYKFKVVGVLAPTGTAQDRAVFISLQSAWILHAHDRHEAAEAKERADKKAAGVAVPEEDHEHEKLTTAEDLIEPDRQITGALLRAAGGNTSPIYARLGYMLRQEAGLTVASPSTEIRNLFSIVGNISQILVAMAGVVGISSGIAIMLALYNSMEQRRRQIAVLRVLGCSRPRVFGLVLVESAMLGVFGAAAGIGAAAVGGWLVALVMKTRLGLVVDPGLSPLWVLSVAGATVALGALAGVVPAVMAYRTTVAKNLRPLG